VAADATAHREGGDIQNGAASEAIGERADGVDQGKGEGRDAIARGVVPVAAMRFTKLTASTAVLAACAHAPDHHAGHGHHGGAHAMPHRFDDAARWAQEFESPERDAWQRPDLVVSALSLPRDARVADLGAGTGYFAVRLARAVPEGRVWGVDIEPAMVRWMLDRARRENLPNLTATLAAPDDALLPEPVDLVLVVDTYHHIDARTAYFTALRRSLRPGGRVVIVDFTLESPVGPPAAMRLAPAVVRQEFAAAGYAFERSVEGLTRQYMLVFRAP
jgi:SAM-dependent methyltransferase